MQKVVNLLSLEEEGGERGSGQRFPSHIKSAAQLAIINRNSIQILNFLDDIGLRKQTK